MNKSNVLGKYFIWGIYVGTDGTAWDCRNYVRGYLTALWEFEIITEEEFSKAKQLNEDAYEAFQNSDNDE